MSSDAQQGRNQKITYLAVGLGMLLVFLFYLIHLFSMQVLEGLVYQSQANTVSSRSQIVSSLRGSIYDRNLDLPIAGNESSYALMLTPGDLGNTENRDILIRNLQPIVGLSAARLEELVPLASRNYDPVLILSNVSYGSIARIAESIEDFPGLSWLPRPQRSYPDGELFAQILGYVGDISQEELQVLFNQGYNPNSIIGKAGIERSMDAVLRGRDGLAVAQVDVFGRRTSPEDMNLRRPPVLGNNVVLTIDRKIQDTAKKALGGRIGSVLVMKPNTGEILAMVSEPAYDPNGFYGQGGAENFRTVSNDPHSPFLNRTIQAAAPPASSFKILMSLIAMEERVIDPFQTIYCSGSITIGDRVFRCWVHSGHGPLNLFQALAQSCNIYFYTLGYDYLDVERISDWSQKLGLGRTSGLDLPGEIRGLVPTPEWKERTFNVPWVGGDTVNMSIGQGYLTVTPIQMANVVNALVNNGVVYKPHVLKEIRDPVTFEILQRMEPEIAYETGLSQSSMDIVKEAMRHVIAEGTAISALTTDSVQIAGKTGTGQTGVEESLHSWFVSYGPYDYQDPDEVITVVVWVDAVNEWDWWAPKAANIIYHAIFNNMSYEEAIRDLSPLWYITPEMLE